MDRETTEILSLKKLNNYEHGNFPDECSFIAIIKTFSY